jgi:hypothetical protein
MLHQQNQEEEQELKTCQRKQQKTNDPPVPSICDLRDLSSQGLMFNSKLGVVKKAPTLSTLESKITSDSQFEHVEKESSQQSMKQQQHQVTKPMSMSAFYKVGLNFWYSIIFGSPN